MTRIEKLLPPAQPGRAWTVVLESGDPIRLPEGAVVEFALYDGLELDDGAAERLRERSAVLSLQEQAASLLSSRLLSTGQLREKLTRKGATAEQAETVIAWAEEIGLLNDREYANALVRYCQSKGYGYYKIRDELYRRRVPRDFWEDALEEMDDPDAVIDRFLERKLQDPADRKQVKRASDALVRRGFTWRQAAEGIERARARYEE